MFGRSSTFAAIRPRGATRSSTRPRWPTSLEAAGIAYRHAVELGGRLSGEPGAERFGCLQRARVQKLRGPHGERRPGSEALAESLAEPVPCFMCAETLWWKCHRRLIADLLEARGHGGVPPDAAARGAAASARRRGDRHRRPALPLRGVGSVGGERRAWHGLRRCHESPPSPRSFTAPLRFFTGVQPTVSSPERHDGHRVSYDCDLLVIGSGPAGQKAAIQAAKLRRKVILVERRAPSAERCVNTGTIPSKTIREAIVYLTGLNQRAIYGQGYRLRDEISIEDIRTRTGRWSSANATSCATSSFATTSPSSRASRASSTPHTVAGRRRSGGERRALRRVDHPADRLGAGASSRRRVQRRHDLRLRRASCASARSPTRSSWSAPASSGSSTRRCSRPSAAKVTVVDAPADDARLLRPGDHRGAALSPPRPRCDLPLR